MQIGQYVIKITLKLKVFAVLIQWTDVANLDKSPKVDTETMR